MKIVRCSKCGNIAFLLKESGVPMMCCGEKMKELDVDFVQGYYFSRPVDSKNFIKFMFEYKER